MARAFRRFLNRVTRLFGRGTRVLDEASGEWAKIIEELAESQRHLSDNFGKLKIGKQGNKLRIGEADGWSFTKRMRRGNSIPAFEDASRIKVPSNARSAFESMDRTARADFPERMVDARDTYLRTERQKLIDEGTIKPNQQINDPEQLQAIILNNPRIGQKISKLERYVRTFKRITILGVTITMLTFTIMALCQLASKAAKEHSGCFMYTNGGTKITKCKILGCSCNTSETTSIKCLEDILPDDMKLRNTACDPKKKEYYCVHCDWDETDSNSINYIDKDNLPDNVMIVCEQKDGWDIIQEAIGGSVEDGWNAGNEMISGASDSSTDLMQYFPMILMIVIGIIGLVFVINILKAFGGIGSGGDGDEGGGKSGGNIKSVFE